MNHRIPAIIAAALLILFLLPYIWKLKEVSLLVLLAFGVFLAVFDFVVSNRRGGEVNLQPQHASYEEEST
jgi:uncharacterized membrane protein YccC